MKLTPRQYRTFRRIQKKYNVSVPFILSNMDNIRKFVWYAMCPRLVIKRMAVRRQPGQRIVIEHYRLRRVLFDQSLLRIIKRRKRNVTLWSKSMVNYLRRTVGVKEYVEDHFIQLPAKMSSEDVNRQLKAQLELLKSGKRLLPLLNNNTLTKDAEKILTEKTEEEQGEVRLSLSLVSDNLKLSEMTPEKQMILDDPTLILAKLHKRRESDCSTDKTDPCDDVERTKRHDKVHLSGSKFIDMLMSKVNSTVEPAVATTSKKSQNVLETYADASVSSNEDFAGFEEMFQNKTDDAPTLLPTPIVTSENSIFESAKLDKFLKANDLENVTDSFKDGIKKQAAQLPVITNGLVRLHSAPPAMEKPLVPPSLQRLRTVAERRQYLQRHARNYKLAIINNEATIYRELQRKSKRRSNSILGLQSADNPVPFTREGWRVASFLATEVNKYYFQVLPVDDVRTCVHLPGVQGNNTEYYLKPYFSRVKHKAAIQCDSNCVDAGISRKLKLLKSQFKNTKLLGQPLRAVLPACPLSHKPFQKPLDDDTLIAAGGNMLIVRMPNVELEVFPEVGKPLDEIAKRYLENELPYENITQEWAEFSVSTLLQPHLGENQKCSRKSFVFPIAYANERNQILARYVINRSEKLDKTFQTVASAKEAHDDLKFRANIDETDEDLVVCADVLSDMINCVAISCSENSFIKDDPDVNYNKEEMNKTCKTELKPNEHKPTLQKKGNCQVNELKRLDAIIIDAGVQADKSDESQSCTNDYCTLGCICGSLNEKYPFRQHCGKSRCIIECVCKNGPLGRIMRLETDGRIITSEAAYQIHQQATASLARNEKKFSATVVITENGSLVINESQYDKKRRCTKVPKRYEDFTESTDNETSSDFVCTPIKKQISLETLSSNIIQPPEPVGDQTIYVKETVLEQLKHCTVSLTRLELPTSIEPWCMVHELYKCFCNGTATEGRPVHFYKEKDAEMLQNAHDPDKVQPEIKPIMTRPYYSFERKEKTTKRSLPEDDEYGSLEKKARGRPRLKKNSASAEEDVLAEPLIDVKPQTENDDLSELKLNYLLKNPNQCRRMVPIPSDIYQRCNESRVTEVRSYVRETETEKTQLLLNEHTLRSVYFHKQEVDQARKRVEETRLKNKKMCKQIQDRFIEHMKRKCQSTKVEEKKAVLEKETEQMELKLKKEIKVQTEKRKYDNNNELEEDVKTCKKIKPEIVELSDDDDEEAATSISNESIEQFTMPKISNCYSLNSQQQMEQAPAASSSCQIMAELTNNRSKVNKELYAEVMLTMNQLVAKKMQDVDFALKRVCKVIPQPNNEILSLITWTNFLQAFKAMDIFIWQVKMPFNQFLVVTLTKTMPIVEDAVAVVNIIFHPKSGLSLMGCMLVDGVDDGSTSKLAIIMQGRSDYWLIKGFLRADERSACPKPTPQTHPLLTRKINVLFTLLMKQRLRRLQRIQEQALQLTKQQKEDESQTPQAMLRAALMKPLQKATVQRSLLKTITDGNGKGDNVGGTSVIKLSNLKSLLQNQNLNKTNSDSTVINDVTLISNKLSGETTKPATTAVTSKTTTATTTTNTCGIVSKFVNKKPIFKDFNIASNLHFRRVTSDDLLEFHQPIMFKEDHRWLVLDIKNDFSHILVHDFRDLMPLDRVQQMMKVSNMSKKIIRLQFCQDGAFDAFVTPSSNSKLYFGPLKQDAILPKIILLQSVDGIMMTREQFQKKHNISPDVKNCTTGFYMLQIHGEIYFEYNEQNSTTVVESSLLSINNKNGKNELQKMNKLNLKKAKQLQQNYKNDDDDDDDCLIIDEDVNKTTKITTTATTTAATTTTISATTTTKTTTSVKPKPMYQFAIQQQKNSLQIINETKISVNDDEPPANHISIVSTRSSFLPLMLPKSITLTKEQKITPKPPALQQPPASQQPKAQPQSQQQQVVSVNKNETTSIKRKLEIGNAFSTQKVKIVPQMSTLTKPTMIQIKKTSTSEEQTPKPIAVLKTNGIQIPAETKITVLNNDKMMTNNNNNNKVTAVSVNKRDNLIISKNGSNIAIKPKVNVYSANNSREASSTLNKTMPPSTKRFNVVKQKQVPQMKSDTRIFSGVISSVQPLLPTFNFKRIHNDYFIKMMNSSILRFTGSEGVSTYLNEYCEKTLPNNLKKFLPVAWRFRLIENEVDKNGTTKAVPKLTQPNTTTTAVLKKTPTKNGKFVTILPKNKELETLNKPIKRKSMPVMTAAETIVIED